VLSGAVLAGITDMARRRKPQNWPRRAQIKVRLPEPLRYKLEKDAASRGHSMNTEIIRRYKLEKDAASRGHSMNTEIIRRLHESFFVQDQAQADQAQAKVVAETLLDALPGEIVSEIAETIKRWEAEDAMADSYDETWDREHSK
jgi:hypothetical protein